MVFLPHLMLRRPAVRFLVFPGYRIEQLGVLTEGCVVVVDTSRLARLWLSRGSVEIALGRDPVLHHTLILGLGTNTMRSSRVFTLVAGVALLAACGGDGGGNGTQNDPPAADFTFDCNDLACIFTDASTDNDGTVQSLAWDFGDPTSGSNSSTGKPTATHTFSAAGTFQVKLTATDNNGDDNAKTIPVTVTAGTPGGPTASFDVTCGGLSCTLDNTSTATGTTITYAWNFGDGQTSTAEEPGTVTYDVTSPTTFTITLVVTADGNSSQASHQVRVSPGATLTCGTTPDCTLLLDQRATVKVTLVSTDCQAHNNTFVITQPAVDTLFTDGCFTAPGTAFDLNSGAAYDAGTELAAEVLTGVAGSTNAQLQVTGDFNAGWTLKFDDGFVGPNEPDFNDLEILVKATPAP
jgi:PKD repeat protein